MLIYIPILLLAVLLVLGTPVYVSLGLAATTGFLLVNFPLGTLADVFYNSLTPAMLLAVPFFIITAKLMTEGGISDSLVRFAKAWVGPLPGGLGVATILACMVFSAISGSSVATTLAIGAITIPAMTNAGYEKSYAMGVVSAGATLGILIPPSIPLILYGFITGASVRDLFIAALLPGIAAACFFSLTAVLVAWKRGYARLPKETAHARWQATRHAFPSMLLPILILGGIYGGVYTPTEASLISVVYALVIGQLFYDRMGLKQILMAVGEALREAAFIMAIIGSAILFGHYLTVSGLGGSISSTIESAGVGPYGFLIMTFLVLVALGTFMEVTSMLLIMVPLLMPVMMLLNVDAIHFAVLFVIAMEIGLITPPVGMNLFIVTRVAEGKLQMAIRGAVPYILVLLGLALLVLFVPSIILFSV